MNKGDYLSSILRSAKTVFSSRDIALIWHEPLSTTTWTRLHYYVERGDLNRIRNGFYSKNLNYNKLELATRILTPAYVSFETVLAREGLIFQFYDSIFIASYTTREIFIDQQIYSFRKMKKSILADSSGIENAHETSIASKERAFLDMIYLNTDYHFDNTRPLDWDKVFLILPIYHNQRMTKRVDEIYQKANQPVP